MKRVARHDMSRWSAANTRRNLPGGEENTVDGNTSHTFKPGSRHRWGRCGARTRGARLGRTCRASGCGFGRRCAMHGGLRVGALWRGMSIAAPRPTRRFVLITSCADILSDAFDDKQGKRSWKMWAVPEDLAALLPVAVLAMAAEIGYIQTVLVQCGVRRDVARKWPQALGYRIVLRLAERGRIAFGVVSTPKDAMRVGRIRVRKCDAGVHRIESRQILQALQAAGTTVLNRRCR
jgi:hypothetical protein